MPTVAVVHAEPSLLRPFQGPVFSDMIRRHEDLVAAVRTQSAELEEGGDVPQVEVSDDSLLFRFDDHGRRVRTIVGSEAMREAASTPERFSCSVLARAVAQQAVLPIVAHVNGPAENAYFAQLRGVFDVMDVAVPACWPRPSVTFVDPHQVSVSERLGIERKMLAADTSTWPGPPETSHSTTFDELQASFAERLAALRSTTSDDGLRRGVGGFAKRVDDGLAKLRRSFDKQAERSGGIGRGARRRLAEIMRPRGRPQERVLGPIVLLKRAPRVTGEILLQLDPLDFRHHVVTLEDQDFLLAEGDVKDSQ